MKKYLSVIIGIVAGLAVSTVMIVNSKDQVAHGKMNWWNKIVAEGQSINWNDVFSPSSVGKNIYTLVYDKMLVYPEDNALKFVGKNNGLTIEEAQAVVDGGSITPIFNNPNAPLALSQEDALLRVEAIRDEYENIKEIFELEQEINLTTRASELFANDDLSDSGFDLVYDLSVIEEIMFVDVIPNTVGHPFGNQLDSPYLPTEGAEPEKNVEPAADATILGLEFNESDGGTKSDDLVLGDATLTIGDEKIETEILSQDVCTEEDPLASALADYEAENATNDAVVTGNSETDALGDLIEDVEGSSDFSFGGGVTDKGEIMAVPKDKWAIEWCSAASLQSQSEDPDNPFGDGGFESLGGVVNDTLMQAIDSSIKNGNKSLALHLSLCVETSAVKTTVSSYQPGDSCVLCEIEKIDELLDKTLSYSLIPNKTTGNYLESAKCKDAIEIPQVDMKFIAIAAPVPTPPNDQAVFGKNIFEEWNKFVGRYQPFLFKEVTFDLLQEKRSNNLPEGATQNSVFDDVNKDVKSLTAQNLQEIKNLDISDAGKNVKLYAQTVAGEVAQMTAFFKNYKKQYDEIYGVCKSIGEKSYID